MDEQGTGLQTPKKSNKSWLYVLGAVVLLALIGFGAWALTQDGQNDDTATDTKNTTTQQKTGSEETAEPETTDATAPDSVDITYTDSGFDQGSYTVAAGGTVKVTNNSSSDLQFSSDDHPSHLENSELNQAVLSSGESQEFTVTSTGTWGIHDHLNAANTTTLVVQ